MSTKLSQNLSDAPVPEQTGGITSRTRCVVVAVACLAILLALSGCTSLKPNSSPTPTPSVSPSAKPTTTPIPASTVAICTASQLLPWAGPNGAATGTKASEFAFTNVSSQTCALYGYPTVQMLDSSGNQIPTTDQPDQPGSDNVTPELVVLGPGQRAYFMLFYPDTSASQTGTCPTSSELQFTPPGLTTSLTITGTGAQVTPYGGSVENLQCGQIMVTPVTGRKLLPATVGTQ